MEGLRRDVGLFIYLVLMGWEQYAEAGMTGLVIYLGEKICKKPVSWKILKWAAISFLFFAFFNVWRDQYHATQNANAESSTLHAQLNVLKMPNISGEFTSWAIAPAGKENCLVTIFMHLRNGGAPTALEEFSFLVSHNAQTFHSEFLPPTTARLFSSASTKGPGIEARSDDNLLVIIRHQSLSMNGTLDGWFQVIVFGLTPDEFRSKGTAISLKFTDVATGKPHSVDYAFTGEERKTIPDIGKMMGQTR